MQLDLNMYDVEKTEVAETKTREIVLVHKETGCVVDPIHILKDKKFKLNLNSGLFKPNPLDDDPCGTIRLGKLVGDNEFSIYDYASKHPHSVRIDIFSVYEKSIISILVGTKLIRSKDTLSPWEFLFTVEEFIEFILNGDIYIC
ncbi:hypothetical protein [Providencia phage PSTCR6]|nr:hypothetical protein [Providencia phage PSTCR6]